MKKLGHCDQFSTGMIDTKLALAGAHNGHDEMYSIILVNKKIAMFIRFLSLRNMIFAAVCPTDSSERNGRMSSSIKELVTTVSLSTNNR